MRPGFQILPSIYQFPSKIFGSPLLYLQMKTEHFLNLKTHGRIIKSIQEISSSNNFDSMKKFVIHILENNKMFWDLCFSNFANTTAANTISNQIPLCLLFILPETLTGFLIFLFLFRAYSGTCLCPVFEIPSNLSF